MYDENLVLDNLKLIHKCIKDMHCYYDTDDEYQNYYDAGLEGLIRGAKTYKPEIYKPSTYLVTCIRHQISKYMQLSETANRKINKLKMASLDNVVGEDNDTTLGELIKDESIDIEREVEQKIQIEGIIKMLNSMKNQKDALAIKMHYGLDGYTPKTYEEIGKEFGVTNRMICIRVNRALKRLREKSKNIERKVIVNDKLIFKEQKNSNSLEEVGTILLEQLRNLKKIDFTDNELAKMEIAKSNAIASTSKVILQTVGMQLMINKNQTKFTMIGK